MREGRGAMTAVGRKSGKSAGDAAERVIMHVDMDAYFASVEERCNPSLAGRPIAVVGAQARTVILSPSYAARAYGVKTGMTAPEALRLYPDLILVPARNERYTDTCDRIIPIFQEFTPLVEVYSIDECFLDVTGSVGLFGGAEAIARGIKERIKREMGLTCSIGIAPNKLLAKLGSRMRKPDGLVVIRREDVPHILENLPVGELWGIGPQLEKALTVMGIRTCGELGQARLEELTARFGMIGEKLSQMGKGRDTSPVIPTEASPLPKSIGHSMTLPRDVLDREVLERHLLQLSEMVGRRLRREKLHGKTVALTLRYPDFYTFARHFTLRSPIQEGKEIHTAALVIFRTIRLQQAVRLLGVSISHLMAAPLQLPLFTEGRRRMLLTEVMDGLNDRYGEFTVTWAALRERYRHKGVISPAWRPAGSRRVEFHH